MTFFALGAGAEYALRVGCACVACMAPPPMTAPPHAQAQSFVSAIRTDMANHPFYPSSGSLMRPTDQNDGEELRGERVGRNRIYRL